MIATSVFGGFVGSTTADHNDLPGTFVNEEQNDRPYRIYLPSGYDASTERPLVVYLLGCTKDTSGDQADLDQAIERTEIAHLAEEKGFVVAFADQDESYQTNDCWNWYDYEDRASGEPAIINRITENLQQNYSVDRRRTYVAGLSAGAAMTNIMIATYPHQYAAGFAHSGLEYDSADTGTGALDAMDEGGPDPDTKGIDARQEMDAMDRQVPMMVVHGGADTRVEPVNGNQTSRQWAQTIDLAENGQDDNSFESAADTVPGEADRAITHSRANRYDSTEFRFVDDSGDVLVNYRYIPKLEHDWSGGDGSESHADPNGPEVRRTMWKFFDDKQLPAQVTVNVDDFEDDDGLDDYDMDAHDSAGWGYNSYFTDTDDEGSYDGSPPEGSYDLGAYSDGNVVATHSYDNADGAPFTSLPQAGDEITFTTQADCYDGECSDANTEKVHSGFIFGAQDADNKYMLFFDYDDEQVALYEKVGGTWSSIEQLSYTLDSTGVWHDVSIDWGENGDITVTVSDESGNTGSFTATDSTFSNGGIGFYKYGGGAGDGKWSLAYWDNVQVVQDHF
jgi:poly(hydroxyalkanoate) depolymerase family esterase